MPSLPLRSSLDKSYTWNAESVFATPEAWSAEVDSILASLPEIKKREGTLKDAASLLHAFEIIEGLMARVNRAYVYAGFSYSVDTTDQSAAAMSGKAQGMCGQVMAAAAFLNPEVLAIGQKKLKKWMKDEPRLAVYEQFFNNLFRKQEHVRSGEVEEILGMLADPFSGAGEASSMLRNADMKIPSIKDKDGNEVELSEAFINLIVAQNDRDARRESWENYHAELLKYKNTLAAAPGSDGDESAPRTSPAIRTGRSGLRRNLRGYDEQRWRGFDCGTCGQGVRQICGRHNLYT